MRRPNMSRFERWEVALVKAMVQRGGWNDQQILAYFTRPTRSVNHRVISEIRSQRRHASIRPSSEEELNRFLASWPQIDPDSGLNLVGDELLIKAREAMIAAISTFNGAGLYFRSELFIVTCIIAWTYLMHAFYRREGLDYRYYVNVDGHRQVAKTEHGAEKYWELGKCLRANECPLSVGEKNNLEFLLEIRHEIEHRSTSIIDESLSAKLQACCINFNHAIRRLFGSQYGLERRLPIALQLVTFSPDQQQILKAAADLPAHLSTMMDAFHARLTPEEAGDPRFAYRFAFVPKVVNRPSSADAAVEFVRGDSEEAAAINRVLLKEVERQKYKPKQIVDLMRAESYINFNMTRHTELWKTLDAQNPNKGFGARMSDGQWYWYSNWIDRVRAHCEENASRYQELIAQPTA